MKTERSQIVSNFFFVIFIIFPVHWKDFNATGDSLFFSKEFPFADPDWIGFHADFDFASNGKNGDF